MSIKHIINLLKDHFKNKPIVVAELGVLEGEGIPHILNSLNVKEYYGVDLFDCCDKVKSIRQNELMKNYGNNIFTNLSHKYKNDKRVNIIKAYTHQAVTQFPDNFFDLVFIDAGHAYEQVSQDINLWYPKMKMSGIFSGDDYFFPPVQKAVGEFVNKHHLKLYNSSSQNYDAKKAHGKDHPSYFSWYVKI